MAIGMKVEEQLGGQSESITDRSASMGGVRSCCRAKAEQGDLTGGRGLSSPGSVVGKKNGTSRRKYMRKKRRFPTAKISGCERRRRRYLLISLSSVLGFLFVFSLFRARSEEEFCPSLLPVSPPLLSPSLGLMSF